MVVLEAMACGTPVVGHQGGALPWLIDGGGLTVDVTDKREFSAAFESVLVETQERHQLQESAIERASEFNYDSWGENLFNAIRGD
jgi:glycosyltransferase involved in cell wall biosynthesis